MEPKGNKFEKFLLTSYLDEVEDRVEALRRQAQALNSEKESLLMVMAQLKAQAEGADSSLSQGDCQDMMIHIENLEKRCTSVSIELTTVRTPEQEAAFDRVNEMVIKLEYICLQGDTACSENFRASAQTLLNACVSEASSGTAVDFRFQGMILECKIEDQKSVRHRLECLVDGRCHPDALIKHHASAGRGHSSQS